MVSYAYKEKLQFSLSSSVMMFDRPAGVAFTRFFIASLLYQVHISRPHIFLIYAVEVFLFKYCKRLHVFPSVVEGLQLLEPINISSEVLTYAPGTIMVDDD